MDQEWTWTGSGSGPELDNIDFVLSRGEILLKSGKFWTMDTMDWTDRMIHKVGSIKRRMMKQSRAELCGWS